MAVTPAFRDFVVELFERFGPVRVKAMFGEAGIYAGDVFFGLLADDRVHLKADETTRAAFEREGKTYFTFKLKSGDIGAMSYYEIPDRLYDDPDELAVWAMKAVEAALRAKAAKGKKSGGAKKRPTRRGAARK